MPAGRAVKAALTGANTVNGPLPFSVSTRPAALTAATRVVWSLELTALSMMSLLEYIGAPPTITWAEAVSGRRGERGGQDDRCEFHEFHGSSFEGLLTGAAGWRRLRV